MTFNEAMQCVILFWLSFVLTYGVRHFGPWLLYGKGNDTMAKQITFDPNNPDHVIELAEIINQVVNTERKDVRFALLIWQDHHDDIQGVMSNDAKISRVVEMLDDAKLRINAIPGTVHPTSGHA